MVLLCFLHNLAATGASLGARGTLVILGATLNAPVEDVVVLIAFPDEQVSEELAEVRVIGFVIEAESTGIVQEDAKLVGETAAEEVGGGGHLLLHDTVVLLLLGSSLEALPWESTTKEVHEDVGKGLEIITTSLLDAQVGVDGGVTGGTSQVLVLAVGNMEMGLWVTEFLRKTKVDNVDLVATFSNAHQEVVGLDVTMDEVAGVDVLDTRDLDRGHQYAQYWLNRSWKDELAGLPTGELSLD